MQKTPEVGQPVRFYIDATVYAAQVTHVWGPDCVNLTYFDGADGQWKQKSSVMTNGTPECWGFLSA
jgi:hypothetical protein